MKHNTENGKAPLALDALRVGESAVISSVDDIAVKGRLAELGICPGETVVCAMKSPLGDPCAYLIRGSLFAVRKRDASHVKLLK